ncbi:FAD/NAD(P)-binding domain-containing protein [Thozetella sp. PMI_491]|nr:FAD/NAD(P)-binding domain-containing protein [Thozetella sp. PMI_491]
MTATDLPVAVIGAGPVGLFTALLLAQSGVRVSVYEVGAGINQSPRAVCYFPSVMEEFEKAGVLQEVQAAGDTADGVDWKDVKGNVLCGLNAPPNTPTAGVFLGQPEVCEIFVKKLLSTGNAEIHFNHAFDRLEQQGGIVTYWIRDQVNNKEQELTCQYLVGADGGRSTVRRSLGIQLDGYTWESLQFVAVNFQYPLSDLNWKKVTFVVDPENWAIVVKRGKGNSWRMATGIRKPNINTQEPLEEETIQAVKERMRLLLPGDTSQIQYEAMAPYTIHQRCVSRYREGNVLLAGDAAHLNNPVGGLGLTTGLLDAAHLGQALRKTLMDAAHPDVLTSYAETRRNIFLEKTDKISTRNFLRLFSSNPADAEERNKFFTRVNDPKQIARIIPMLMPDMSLTSTSERIFDATDEVTWFISVTKLADWSEERFKTEYKTVHAGMTRNSAAVGSPLRRYVQLANSWSVPGMKQPEWDYVTMLTMPSLFVVFAGFQHPGYRAAAGAHIFCRLDQQGCIARKVGKYSKPGLDGDSVIGPTRALIYHERASATDEFSAVWLDARLGKASVLGSSDQRLKAYTLWQDVTPKNTEYFFRDTQFVGGSWLGYKGVEAFEFEDQDAASSFFEEHIQDLMGKLTSPTTTVVGEADIIV